MQGLYWGGLILAGALTVAPGRLTYQLFFRYGHAFRYRIRLPRASPFYAVGR